MTTKYKYFDDIYAEIELGTSARGYETVNSLSIYRLDHKGKKSEPFHIAIDFYTNKYLLDLAINVDETGIEGDDL
jgi:hypothetical protein